MFGGFAKSSFLVNNYKRFFWEGVIAGDFHKVFISDCVDFVFVGSYQLSVVEFDIK